MAAKLFSRIEDTLGKKLPLATLFEHATIARLARVLQRPGPLVEQRALLKIHGAGSRLPLYFPPSIGGEAFFLKPLARRLGADQPIWSFQIPEVDGGRKPFHAIETMAAFFVNELTRSQMPGGPYCLAGYSFGAAVALEMAQQLWARGDRVSFLALIDGDFSSPAPRTAGRLLRSAWASLRNLPYWLFDDFLVAPRAQRHARLAKEMRDVVRRLRDPLGKVAPVRSSTESTDEHRPGSLAPEDRALEDAHARALASYRPRPYPGRITLISSRTRSLLASAHAHDFRWAKIAAGGVDFKMIRGNHLNMMYEPFVRALAHELRRGLDRAQARS